MSSLDEYSFRRDFSDDLVSKLLKSPLWPQLRENVLAGEVFPAIRNREMHFYCDGGRLFAFSKNGFRTNEKYAQVLIDIPSRKSKDVSEKGWLKARNRIQNRFHEGINGMKHLCGLYSGPEAKGVSRLYSKYTCIQNRQGQSELSRPIVVLDIEVSFRANERRRDRLDLLLLDTVSQKLLFVEAKHYRNSEIRATDGADPPVLEQLEKYRDHIAKHTDTIVAEYTRAKSWIEKIYQVVLPDPKTILPAVPLLIFGFDGVQERYGLSRVTDVLESRGITCLPVGSTASVQDGTLAEWFAKVEQRR